MFWHPLFTFTDGSAVVVPPAPPPPVLEALRGANVGGGTFGRFKVRQVVRHEDDEVALIASLLARMLLP